MSIRKTSPEIEGMDGIPAAKHHPAVITADARDTTSPDPGWTGPGWPGPRRHR